MRKEEEYLANAGECEANALRSKDPDDRALWLEMAAGWLRKFGREKSREVQRRVAEKEKDSETDDRS
jgi:hypothetical protein